MAYPELYRVRQRFESRGVPDVAAATRAALTAVRDRVPRGTVAVAVGSRGITSIAEIVAAVVEMLRAAGADPFVVPAMGSHGGGTADGQRACLEALGISARTVGTEIRSTMDVVQVATAPSGLRLQMDAAAATADAIVPVNRVKPHTIFGGPFGSGLAKMLLIGLGNDAGARAVHTAAADRSFEALVREAIPILLGATVVPFGLAIVEDARHGVAMVEAVPGQAIIDREPELLRSAIEWMPGIPVDDVDLLVVDEMGKHISGQGVDPNVTGRMPTGSSGVRVARLFVRDLAPASGGNAHGIGQADVTTRRLVEAADWQATWVNTFASGNLAGGRIPPYFDTDREAIDALLGTVGRAPSMVRLVRIRNTLALELAEVSTACLGAFTRPSSTQVEAGPYPMTFDAVGALAPLVD